MMRLLGPPLLRSITPLAALAVLAGCAATGPVDVLQQALTPAQPDEAVEEIIAIEPLVAPDPYAVDPVFDVGYSRISDIYLRSVDLGDLTVDGLAGLSDIDPAFTARRSDGDVELLVDNQVVSRLAGAEATDNDAWAAVLTTAVTQSRVTSPLIAESDTEAVYEAVMDAIIADLDEYSRYVDPEEAEAERASRDGYGGVGLLLNFDEAAGTGFVEDVFEGSPAEDAGMRVGDVFVAVDGVSTVGWTLPDLARELRGPIGTTVTVTIRSVDAPNLRTLTLRRAQVIVDTVESEVRDGIGIMRISRFNAGTLDQARTVLGELLAQLRRIGGTGLIIDLRGNPGGLLDQSVGLADLFIEGGDIITTRGRHPDSFQRFPAGSGDVARGLEIVVLIDSRSASGAEIVAAALQDTGRAVVVGSSSFGKGSVQTVSRLPNGGELFLTWSRIYGPAGITIHRQGVTPTICTSNGLTDADQVLQAFRAGEIPTPDRLLRQRQLAADDDAALEELRSACPWREHNSDLDVDVAIALLQDSALYARALTTAPAAALAAR